jgi:hypothetical protein
MLKQSAHSGSATVVSDTRWPVSGEQIQINHRL